MSARSTPETDAVWADKSQNILEHARKLENERNEAIVKLNLETRNANDAYMERATATTERDTALAKLAKCREALKQIAESTVMRSHDSGECISAEHRDQAREALDATHLIPSQK